MDGKSRIKLDCLWYLYGSTMKALEPVRIAEWESVATGVLIWAKRQVHEMVETLESQAAPPPDASPAPPDPEAPQKQKNIVVKSVEVVKSGESDGRKWTLYRVTDTDGITYSTFAGSRYKVGEEAFILYEETQNGKYVNRKIVESR